MILSACNTAAGGEQGAEALSGLARAFFYAGARALLCLALGGRLRCDGQTHHRGGKRDLARPDCRTYGFNGSAREPAREAWSHHKKTQPHSMHHGFGPARGVELLEDGSHMEFYGMGRDAELPRDGFVRGSARGKA